MNKLAIMVCVAGIMALAMAEGDVVSLKTDNFDEFINNHEITLVKFFAPWCGHCKHLAAPYAQAATTLLKNDPPVMLVEVDCTVETKLAERFGVQGYPTLYIFRKGGEKQEYNGPREYEGIVNFMKGQAGPAFKELATAAELDAFVKENADKQVAVIGYGPKDGAAEKVIKSVSASQRENYRFAMVSDSQLVAARAPSNGAESIVMLKPFAGKDEKEQLLFSEKTYTTSDVLTWLPKAAVPLAGVYDADSAKRYAANPLPRLTVYVAGLNPAHDPSGTRYILNRLRKVAAEFKGQVVFTIANKETDHDAANFNFPAEAKMAYVVVDNGHKYKGDVLSVVDGAKIKEFVNQFLSKAVEEYIKSEALPTGEQEFDKDVKVIVGKNFNSEVLNSNKDVFIVAYAPWCGHCKQLHPKWEEMAGKLKEQRDKITIAKIDATANDMPAGFDVKGFPTIFFVKAGSNKPEVYQGPREVKDLLTYAKNHAVNKIKDEL